MKSKWITVVLIVVLVAGLSLLLYPTLSAYWNEKHATKTIASYSEDISHLEEEKIQEMWEAEFDYEAIAKEATSCYSSEVYYERLMKIYTN